ncbi:MAG: hypothetical protein Q8P74_00820, partial [bacterium]|nr:hypothetical protein [bacterium]
SFWHINFSRIGFRAILTPLVLTFSFYFLFRGLRTKKIQDFIISGLIFGIGFHTYISFRLAVLVLAFVLLFWFFIAAKENWRKRYLIFSAIFLLAILITATPIGIYFLKNPQDFMSRALGVSIFGQESPIKEFVKSLTVHLSMFNFAGDRNLRHNLPGFPQLSPVAGIFFLAGMFWVIRRIITLFKSNRAEKLAKIGTFLFLFVWFFALILPSALTIEGIPHALRSIGVIPVVYLFTGLGAYLIYQWGKNKWEGKKIKTAVFKASSFLLLIAMTLSSFVMYFVVWAKNPELENAFTTRFTDVGKELNALPAETKKYVIKNEGDLPTEVSKFIQRTAGRTDDAIYIQPEEIGKIDFIPGDFIFIMNKELRFLDPVREVAPTGILHEKERIWIYEIR